MTHTKKDFKSSLATRYNASVMDSNSTQDSNSNQTAKKLKRQLTAKADDQPYNILFILTDQERYLDSSLLPEGYILEGRERLQRHGVTFTNHQIASAVCTSSRSVIYTGRHIQQTKMFDNLDFPWAYELDPNIGTLGQLLQKANYYTAYKGKWHLSDLGEYDEQDLPDPELTKIIESYGFHDYVGIGDVIGMVHGGWINDDLIIAQAKRWLRVRGKPLNQSLNQPLSQSLNTPNNPWFLAVNLVNPHDVMFYNTDAPEQHIQDTPTPLIGLARAPETPFYQQQWDISLPASRHEPYDKQGRPSAHGEYQVARDTQVGAFPNEDARWQRLLNYYYNCILATDRQIVAILDELEALGLADNTVIVMTSDHGELGGSHGLHGKGTTAYQEQNHVPLYISHPAYVQTHGQQCQALTSHLDLVPTLLAWTGATPEEYAQLTQHLRGKNLTPLLEKGEQATVNEIREGALYCFNMLAYLDGNFMENVRALHNRSEGYVTEDNLSENNVAKNKTSEGTALEEQPFTLDLSKRGAIRSVFDGRYKYTRYFSPKQHNRPQTLDDIFKLNDVELFDLQVDPDEMQNLAVDADKHADLILAMNAKLNALLDSEVDGPDDGSFLPDDVVSSTATKAARRKTLF